MAAPTDNVMLTENESVDMCEIEATVATGFEQTAKEEVEEKFGITAKAARGKVIAIIPVKDVKKVLDLGCVDNIRVVMTSWKDLQFPQDELECMGKLRELVKDVDWAGGLQVWKQMYTFEHPILSTPISDTVNLGEPFLFRKELPKKQPKDKKGKSGKKDKFGKKVKDWKKDKRKEDPEAKPESGEPGRPPDLQFVGNEGQYVQPNLNQVQGYYGNGQIEEGQFDDVESDSDTKQKNKNEDQMDTSQNNNTRTESDLSAATAELSLNKLESQNQNATDLEKQESKVVVEETPLPQAETPGETKTETEVSDKSSKTDTLKAGSSVDPRSSHSSPQQPSSPSASLEKPKEKLVPHNPLMPSFRVTCNRAGEGHKFDSQGAAANFGGAVQHYFGWNVDMKNFNIEVILNIEWNDVSACIGLTRESLHHRNIAVFGATTLRPTIAHNMLRLCKIQPGEVVCDPMCGSGSIPIQAARCWPQAFHLSGEKFTKAVDRTVENVVALNKVFAADNKPPVVVDAAYWDVNYLPFRENCIDVFITDLPFGKRMGSRFSNQKLYPDALMEMARVCRPGSGRVCLLTQDKKCIIKAIQALSRYWQRRLSLSINLGGLAAGVYLLNRTQVPVVKRGLPQQEERPRESGCRDFRTSMPSDPRSGPGFTVVRHTFNTAKQPESDSPVPDKPATDPPVSEMPLAESTTSGLPGSDMATSEMLVDDSTISGFPVIDLTTSGLPVGDLPACGLPGNVVATSEMPVDGSATSDNGILASEKPVEEPALSGEKACETETSVKPEDVSDQTENNSAAS